MIEAIGLTKQYGDKKAVDGLTFTVRPGMVTGFLGPNGAGKSTTMRMILGLDAPTSGTVTVNGRPYGKAVAPMREVGALLDAKAIHGGRTAYNHLLALAQSNRLPQRRVGEVLELTGLTQVAKKRSGGFSLGMGQRLGIAAALLGDPRVLMFDEPVNGLDPDGIRWIREFMRRLAAEGRTVFVSSHLMSEMEHTADHLIVIGRGRLQADMSVKDFIARNSEQTVTVRTPETMKLLQLLAAKGARVTNDETGLITVRGATPQQIGDLAFENQIRVHELAPHQGSLEEAFMEMTRDQVEYRAVGAGGPGGPVAPGGPGPYGPGQYGPGPGGPVPPQNPYNPGQPIGAR
ncbi:MAG: ATP-binding cassette domain-containing protein [Catenulispora sp.]|nr:ATP-binding cassette domain-containing protein [Catenulispora sp.]